SNRRSDPFHERVYLFTPAAVEDAEKEVGIELWLDREIQTQKEHQYDRGHHPQNARCSRPGGRSKAQPARTGCEEACNVVLLQFVLQLRVGLRHRVEQLIGLVGDLNAEHPYRAEDDEGKGRSEERRVGKEWKM